MQLVRRLKFFAGRLARIVLVWGSIGGVFALTVTMLRAFAPDAPVPRALPLDLERDVAWVAGTMPAEVQEFYRGPAGDGRWRLNGMRQVWIRFGEIAMHLQVWRRNEDRSFDRSPAGTVDVWRVRRGFPFRCLEGSSWSAVPTAGRTAARPLDVSLLRIPRASDTDAVLPTQVIWWGLLGNAAVYGGFLLLLTRLPVAAERWWRRHNHRCAECGHPLLGAARCSECGASAVQQDAVTMRQ
ncbi:MAG: hypothetical protein SGJ11_18475 [Phycisphaerae bacterium]|nr:hypothetical protein [Phycisphaerae bacterium]